MERAFDVVVWGATGFTGRLVARYLAEHHGGARVALAGRDLTKLDGLRASLPGDGPRFPILCGDASDRGALDAVVRQARVVATTVGPYARYGDELVAACVDAGTHCCDLTGEVPWMRKMIDLHHDRAAERGVRVVHTCGFDSLPSDLGVLRVQALCHARFGRFARRVRLFAGEARGGFSGGTIASMLELAQELGRDRAVARLLRDPYALNPAPRPTGPDQGDPTAVEYVSDLGQWAGVFLMASVNTRVVRRAHALRGSPYGHDFRYSEQMSFGRGPLGLARALGVTAALGGFFGAVRVEALRNLLQRHVLPPPGQGPSEEAIARGFFVVRLLADEIPGHPGERVQVTVRGSGDPGYGATARMLSEAALCLALDPLDTPFGDLPPSIAMGEPLVERLARADVRFEDEPPAA
ncbi:MAG: saccharopine dehydrogenase NADP-binding domain-containing protein [Deltaproteobacteria bacterium]|nr:saccharopine dehydrogenase NADP-binding domain-containing protein [Deltaproteobacteria bacterium]